MLKINILIGLDFQPVIAMQNQTIYEITRTRHFINSY